MDLFEREYMSYNDYINIYFSLNCLSPYKLYKTKKILFFKRKIFLKNIPCGICYNCLKNKGYFKSDKLARSSFDLNSNLQSIDLKEFFNAKQS